MGILGDSCNRTVNSSGIMMSLYHQLWVVLLVVLVAAPNAVVASDQTGLVVRVVDGDTITFATNENEIQVRLSGIDAPELSQPFGHEAKSYLESLILHKSVVVKVNKTDRYGRSIGKIKLKSVDQNLLLVDAGLAWWYRYYKADQPNQDQESYEEAETKARAERRGLWSDAEPIEPYLWRRGERSSPVAIKDTACGSRKTCPEMRSCEEAQFYLNQCGVSRLDGDKDGVPCEGICSR